MMLPVCVCSAFFTDVIGVGHDVDLALLTVEDDDFWLGTDGNEVMKPLQLGDVPQLQVPHTSNNSSKPQAHNDDRLPCASSSSKVAQGCCKMLRCWTLGEQITGSCHHQALLHSLLLS